MNLNRFFPGVILLHELLHRRLLKGSEKTPDFLISFFHNKTGFDVGCKGNFPECQNTAPLTFISVAAFWQYDGIPLRQRRKHYEKENEMFRATPEEVEDFKIVNERSFVKQMNPKYNGI